MFRGAPKAPPTQPAQPEPGALAPPEAMTAACVEAWVRSNLDVEGWTYLDFSSTHVTLASRPALAPVFQRSLRVERFLTDSDRWGDPYRSMLMVCDVDARGERYRMAQETSYRLNNLESPNQTAQVKSGDWHPIDPRDAIFFMQTLQLCQEATGKPQEGPDSRFESDVRAWLDRTVDPRDDILAYTDEAAAMYVQPGSIVRSDEGPAMTVREELFWPITGLRSQTIETQLDVRNRRMRQLGARRFVEHNLVGEPEVVDRIDRWIEARDGFRNEYFDRLCEIAKAAGA